MEPTTTPTIPWYDRLEPFSMVEAAQRLTSLYEPGVKEQRLTALYEPGIKEGE